MNSKTITPLETISVSGGPLVGELVTIDEVKTDTPDTAEQRSISKISVL